MALEYAGGEDEIARLSRASIDGWIDRFATYLRADGIDSAPRSASEPRSSPSTRAR